MLEWVADLVMALGGCVSVLLLILLFFILLGFCLTIISPSLF